MTPKTAAIPANNAPAATRESPKKSDAVAAARATTPSTRATSKTLSQSAHSRIAQAPVAIDKPLLAVYLARSCTTWSSCGRPAQL